MVWVDTITDFARGRDKIHLQDVDADSALADDQNFSFVANPSTHTGSWTGKVWIQLGAGITTVYASTDADNAAEMQINVTGKRLHSLISLPFAATGGVSLRQPEDGTASQDRTGDL